MPRVILTSNILQLMVAHVYFKILPAMVFFLCVCVCVCVVCVCVVCVLCVCV
jgi:hypothetical protein